MAFSILNYYKKLVNNYKKFYVKEVYQLVKEYNQNFNEKKRS